MSFFIKVFRSFFPCDGTNLSPISKEGKPKEGEQIPLLLMPRPGPSTRRDDEVRNVRRGASRRMGPLLSQPGSVERLMVRSRVADVVRSREPRPEMEIYLPPAVRRRQEFLQGQSATPKSPIEIGEKNINSIVMVHQDSGNYSGGNRKDPPNKN